MRSAEGETSSIERRTLSAILVLMVAAVIIDVGSDLAKGASWTHLGTEGALGLLAATGLAVLWSRSLRLKDDLRILKTDLERARLESEAWKTRNSGLIQGLGAAIDAQFNEWKLTPSEKEIASLLLKGFSLKEIADLRGTSERTARQQSLSVYEKAGVAGRAELSAYFLEDLLPPR